MATKTSKRNTFSQADIPKVERHGVNQKVIVIKKVVSQRKSKKNFA
jgi:hypothetical protein